MTNDDPNEEAVGHHKVVIRENSRGERDLGYTTGSDPPTSRSPADYGWGTEVNCHGHGGPWLVCGLTASYPKGFRAFTGRHP